VLNKKQSSVVFYVCWHTQKYGALKRQLGENTMLKPKVSNFTQYIYSTSYNRVVYRVRLDSLNMWLGVWFLIHVYEKKFD